MFQYTGAGFLLPVQEENELIHQVIAGSNKRHAFKMTFAQCMEIEIFIMLISLYILMCDVLMSPFGVHKYVVTVAQPEQAPVETSFPARTRSSNPASVGDTGVKNHGADAVCNIPVVQKTQCSLLLAICPCRHPRRGCRGVYIRYKLGDHWPRLLVVLVSCRRNHFQAVFPYSEI